MGTENVLLIANNFPPVHGGSSVVYDNLARCSGTRMTVVAPTLSYVEGRPLSGWREHDLRAPYTVVRLPLLRTRINQSAPGGPVGKLGLRAADMLIRARLAVVVLWLIVVRRPLAVCIGELLASAWLIDLVRRVSGVPVVVYVHGEEITTKDAYDSSHGRATRALLAADCIIVVSRFTARAVIALVGPEHGKRVRLIENGVDTARFRPGPKRPDLVERYGLRDRFTYVSVCRLVARKGIDNAIRAFAIVARKHLDARFLVVGAGPCADDLRRIAEDGGLADRVIFAGDTPDEDLADHYRLGDVFVMPNRTLPDGDTEGFGLVFLEANACGLPVVAGRDGGVPDAVEDRVNGLLVDGTSVDTIATAMLALRENEDLFQQLRRGGLTRAAAAEWTTQASAFGRACREAGAAR
jgi:phosphatidyl-myo-inositol dimannoside synthase